MPETVMCLCEPKVFSMCSVSLTIVSSSAYNKQGSMLPCMFCCFRSLIWILMSIFQSSPITSHLSFDISCLAKGLHANTITGTSWMASYKFLQCISKNSLYCAGENEFRLRIKQLNKYSFEAICPLR